VGLAHNLVAKRGLHARLAAAFLGVVAPMFLLGLGITSWIELGGLQWGVGIAALLCVSSIAASYLRRPPGVLCAGKLSAWSAAVIAQGSLAGVATVLVALAVAVLISREQMREQRLAEERRQARDRVQTRARDILADYEETRQGWFWETDRRGLLTYI